MTCEELMTRSMRLAALAAGLGLLVLLSGCPGIPGAGGGGASSQQTPPGILPPPGLESGGVRTIVGTTITPPTNNVLLVTYTTSGGAPPNSPIGIDSVSFCIAAYCRMRN